MGRCQPDENGRNGKADPTEPATPYRDAEQYQSRRQLEDAPDDNVAQERLRQHHQAEAPSEGPIGLRVHGRRQREQQSCSHDRG